ncbi:MAG: hypothetical protein M0Z48_00635 [Nitrospiraceae bacterium]|nr:hypothetical protein [Nitrospiraceae bacterium]
MMTEKGTLPVGVEYEGKPQRDFELRPQLVQDSVDAVEEERAQRNESYLGVCVLAKQLTKLGDIPKEKITPTLLMGMYEADLGVISAAARRLQQRLARFSGADEAPEKGAAGVEKAGV